MRVLHFVSENFKNIKVVDITPKDDVIIISGKNSQGKTNLIDGVFSVLDSSYIPKNPIRKGQEKAKNFLDLGEYTATRTFTEKGSILTVANKDGAKFGSPQKLLDKFKGDFSFDPSDFMKKDKKEQAELLLKFIKLNVAQDFADRPIEDIIDLDEYKKDLYNERTSTNKEAKNRKEQIIAIGEIKKVEKIDIKGLFEEKEGINKEIEYQKLAKDDLKRAVERDTEYDEDREEQNKKIAELENKIKEMEEYIVKLDNTKKSGQDVIRLRTEEISKFKDMTSELTAVNKKIEDVDETNRKALLWDDKVKLLDELKTGEEKSNKLTNKLNDIEEVKKKALIESNMPVEGLSIDEGVVTYKGFPLADCATNEQIKVSLSIAMALNPKLNVIRIDNGSELDSDSMKLIKKIAKENDYQIWMEKMDESGKVGFHIEEGIITNQKEA